MLDNRSGTPILAANFGRESTCSGQVEPFAIRSRGIRKWRRIRFSTENCGFAKGLAAGSSAGLSHWRERCLTFAELSITIKHLQRSQF